MHMTLIVVGNDSLDKMMEPFWQDLETPKYKVRELDDDDMKEMLDYYNEKGGNFKTFEECYAAKGEDWNFGHWEKDVFGKWCEYSTSNPNMQWGWWEVGGRWPGRLRLKEGARPVMTCNFSWGWGQEQKKEFLESHKNCCDAAYKKDVANLDELTSYAILIDGQWIELDGEKVAPYLENVTDDTILTCIDYHM